MVKKQEIAKKRTRKRKDKKIKINLSQKWLVISIVSCLLIVFICLLLFINHNNMLITIDNVKYNVKDFNMYAYLVKSEYFGENKKVTSDDLNVLYSNDSDMTVGQYLKEQTIERIKISASISKIAQENNITLDNTDYKDMQDIKNDYIEDLGGKDEFKKLLRRNHTNEKSYDNALESEVLYLKVLDNLYSEGKRFDLTEEELFLFTESYKLDYVKIKQIILLKKDLTTNTYLSDVALNQKKVLAATIQTLAVDTGDFASLIKKYSEAYDDQVESEYYLLDDLVENLKKAITDLKVDSVSDVIETDFAYHIVLKEQLDNEMLEEYLDSKREEKLLEDVSKTKENLLILKGKKLEKISIK